MQFKLLLFLELSNFVGFNSFFCAINESILYNKKRQEQNTIVA